MTTCHRHPFGYPRVVKHVSERAESFRKCRILFGNRTLGYDEWKWISYQTIPRLRMFKTVALETNTSNSGSVHVHKEFAASGSGDP